MTMIGKKSLAISSIGHFRHATLLFTALLLIVTNGCAGSEKVDLKDRCMKYPLHLMCRGSVMKRGVPKDLNWDLLYEQYDSSPEKQDWNVFGPSYRRFPFHNSKKYKQRQELYEFLQSKAKERQAMHKTRFSNQRGSNYDGIVARRSVRNSYDPNDLKVKLNLPTNTLDDFDVNSDLQYNFEDK